MCGNVSADSDQRSSLRARHSALRPSGPPTRKATSRPSCSQPSSLPASASVLNERPRGSSATTRAPSGMALSRRWLSSAWARRGSPALVRVPSGSSTSCNRLPGNRPAYSRTPAATQSGIFCPTLMIRNRTVGLLVRLTQLRCIFFVRIQSPDALEPVELAHGRQHDVDHGVSQIHQDPLASVLALDAERPQTGLLG